MFDFKSANLSNLSTADASAFKDILDSILMPNEESSFVLQFLWFYKTWKCPRTVRGHLHSYV